MNARCGDRYRAFSAGTESGILNPYAVRAMAEIGIDTGKPPRQGSR